MKKMNLFLVTVFVLVSLLTTTIPAKAGDERPITRMVVTGSDAKNICSILFNVCIPKYYKYQGNIYSGTMNVFVQSYTTGNSNNSYYNNGNNYYSSNSNSNSTIYVFNIKYIDIFGRETIVAVNEKVEKNNSNYNYSNMNNFSFQSSGSGALQLDKIIHILNEFYVPPIYNIYISAEDEERYKGKLYTGATCDLLDASGKVLATSEIVEYKKYEDGRVSLCLWPKPEEVKIKYYITAGLRFRPVVK